ncbi:hypothetical protein BAUCODRAFT_34750 [Baudoinia panamericana UAMH 10762]|uniref:Uncharacterized protein n=1 Tax=Baudoinia panamericana (strain UAMH 10762) TaxID=717646 RepID=M2MHA7_BAUPA|nr:uncharacterized protein BAUCODRAFT_34750 [Baudoinia panamericana UAMH 10762]EMC95986.1 hypothetical protein BAUCODRAFT_34750 [Baudoinia panamericana UAMH 10762]
MVVNVDTDTGVYGEIVFQFSEEVVRGSTVTTIHPDRRSLVKFVARVSRPTGTSARAESLPARTSTTRVCIRNALAQEQLLTRRLRAHMETAG